MRKQPERTIADDIFGLSRRRGLNSKAKGNRGELMACKLLTLWTGVKFNRVPQSGGLNWKADNRITGDIVPPLDFNFPFSCEIKNYDDLRLNCIENVRSGKIKKFWLQSEKDAYSVGRIPLLLVKDGRAKFVLFIHDQFKISGFDYLYRLQFLKQGFSLKAYEFENLIAKIKFDDFKGNFVRSE